jgi:hypothetical protein
VGLLGQPYEVTRVGDDDEPLVDSGAPPVVLDQYKYPRTLETAGFSRVCPRTLRTGNRAERTGCAYSRRVRSRGSTSGQRNARCQRQDASAAADTS